jgi:hypothetical protein
VVECRLAMSLGLRWTEKVIRAQVRVKLVMEIAVETIPVHINGGRIRVLHNAAERILIPCSKPNDF